MLIFPSESITSEYTEDIADEIGRELDKMKAISDARLGICNIKISYNT